jgi:hypothetical protein
MPNMAINMMVIAWSVVLLVDKNTTKLSHDKVQERVIALPTVGTTSDFLIALDLSDILARNVFGFSSSVIGHNFKNWEISSKI